MSLNDKIDTADNCIEEPKEEYKEE